VVHRADMQIDRLDATKRPFHQGKGFIAAHRRGVVERLGGQAGTYDIDAVGCRLRGDPRVKMPSVAASAAILGSRPHVRIRP